MRETERERAHIPYPYSLYLWIRFLGLQNREQDPRLEWVHESNVYNGLSICVANWEFWQSSRLPCHSNFYVNS